MSTKALIGIYGGTFDPIHNGHVSVLESLLSQSCFSEIRVIPNFQPPLKQAPQADFTHRLAMLSLALQHLPQVVIDDRESRLSIPSYTFNTLQSLREEYPDQALALIMGVDAFAAFDQWYRWQEILDLSHLFLIPRPSYAVPQYGKLAELIATHWIDEAMLLRKSSKGKIYVSNIATPALSSTQIRLQLLKKINDAAFLPQEVYNYIVKYNLYT